MKIGSVHAHISNVVEGQQYVGDQSVSVEQQAVRQLADAVSRVRLAEVERVEAEAAVRRLDEEMGRPDPDRSRVTEHLGRLTKILRSAGALAGSAAALTDPLTTLARWLGRTFESFLV